MHTKHILHIGIDEAGRAARKRASFAHKIHIGIDEAGRGPLAGPIVVAAVATTSLKFIRQLAEKSSKLGPLKDSKRLSYKKRQQWYEFLITHPNLQFAICAVRPTTIDRINVHQAALLGVSKVLKKIGDEQPRIFLDGSLFAPRTYTSQKTIIKGDTTHPLIMAASIIAKVSRDRLMLRLHRKYPYYGFAKHKGYATNDHRYLVKYWGPSKVHRMSFLSNII